MQKLKSGVQMNQSCTIKISRATAEEISRMKPFTALSGFSGRKQNQSLYHEREIIAKKLIC